MKALKIRDQERFCDMLSILIPSYNQDVSALVKTLHHQCIKEGIPFEIIVLDDCSESQYQRINEQILNFSSTRLECNVENKGRSFTRNRLAELAQYDWLLFLDGDTLPASDEFIHNYIIGRGQFKVIVGGLTYEKEPPEDKRLHLRWKYGIERESIHAKERNKDPYHRFMTGNFMIDKDTYLNIMLDESITRYGHEDTLFGKYLSMKKILIIHIQNPVIHLGLETAGEFLQKTKEGVVTLAKLYQDHKIGKEVKLIRFYLNLKKTGAAGPTRRVLRGKLPSMIKKLKKGEYDARLFDQFKLAHFLMEVKEKK